jgi:hypothetical protein
MKSLHSLQPDINILMPVSHNEIPPNLSHWLSEAKSNPTQNTIAHNTRPEALTCERSSKRDFQQTSKLNFATFAVTTNIQST